ncbi:Protein fam72b, partial [Blyttiomyces sp. JEL0837]
EDIDRLLYPEDFVDDDDVMLTPPLPTRRLHLRPASTLARRTSQQQQQQQLNTIDPSIFFNTPPRTQQSNSNRSGNGSAHFVSTASPSPLALVNRVQQGQPAPNSTSYIPLSSFSSGASVSRNLQNGRTNGTGVSNAGTSTTYSVNGFTPASRINLWVQQNVNGNVNGSDQQQQQQQRPTSTMSVQLQQEVAAVNMNRRNGFVARTTGAMQQQQQQQQQQQRGRQGPNNIQQQQSQSPSVHPQFRSKAGMKAILLGDTRVELYSTDSPPCRVQLVEADYTTQNCQCRIRDVACLQCGNVIGYHVTQPCETCLESCNNGHFWMFLSDGVEAIERTRHDDPNQKLVWAMLPCVELDIESSIINGTTGASATSLQNRIVGGWSTGLRPAMRGSGWEVSGGSGQGDDGMSFGDGGAGGTGSSGGSSGIIGGFGGGGFGGLGIGR